MYNTFDEFDREFLTEEFIDEANNGKSMEYAEIPVGTYDVQVSKLQLTASKKGSPMVSCWFKISNGNFKDNTIFYNQVVSQAFQIHIVNDLLRQLNPNYPVEFISFKQYGEMLQDFFKTINGIYEYTLDYGITSKGFNTYNVKKTYELLANVPF